MTQGAGFAQTTTGGVAQGAPDEDDAALVAGLRRGDQAARHALFERFAPHVERILARCLGRDPELADVLHDTFVQAFASAATLRDSSALKAWLSMIAVHVARGLIRPVRLLLPLGGLSMIDAPGQPFHDPAADAVLFNTLERLFTVTDTHRLIQLPHHINDPAFAVAVAEQVRAVVV